MSELGHSGADLALAVVKTGDSVSILDEVHHIRRLPAIIMPKILGTWEGGYAMEQLERIDTPPAWIMDSTQNILMDTVWSQRLRGRDDNQWEQEFRERFGFAIPVWAYDEASCLTHGDPTLANIMRRDGNLILIDPKPPGRGIPSMRSVDRGKMLQSLLGWECALQDRPIPMLSWPFGGLDDLELRRVIFWTRVHLLRIVQRESPGHRSEDSPLASWAIAISEKLRELIE